MASVLKTSSEAARKELYRRIANHNFAPLWEVYHELIPDQPMTPC